MVTKNAFHICLILRRGQAMGCINWMCMICAIAVIEANLVLLIITKTDRTECLWTFIILHHLHFLYLTPCNSYEVNIL